MSWLRDHGRAGGRRALTAVERQKMNDVGRAAVRAELFADGCSEETAEHWIAAWQRHELDGETRQLWSVACRWILDGLGPATNARMRQSSWQSRASSDDVQPEVETPMTVLGNRDVVERYVRAIPADYDTLAKLRHSDFIEEWPQSGERIRGHSAHRRIHENYPGGTPRPDPIGIAGAADQWVVTASFTIMGVAGSGDEFTTVGLGSYPDGSTTYVVSILRVRDGKVAKATTFFAPPFEPPMWRAAFVETMSEADRKRVLR